MSKGFTLIELLVTIAVFAIIIVAITGIFIAGVRQQKIALETQALLDQISFALEFMGRTLRMSSKDLGQGCLAVYGANYELTRGGAGIKFINTLENNDCQEFYFSSGELRYLKQGAGQDSVLLSRKLNITSARFNIIGETQDDNVQPRVTLFFASPSLKIQTTISQRNLDVQR